MAVLSAVLLASAGCANPDATVLDGGAPTGDGATEPPATLELLSPTEPSLALRFGEVGWFSVRYLDHVGNPVGGATVGLALVGRAHDSSLDGLEATTDAEGIATGQVMAGRVPAAFRVRVTADRAVPVHVDVSVSDAGFGGLRVMAAYDGDRVIAERTIDVYADASCTEDRTFRDAGDRTRTLADGEEQTRFFALPAGITYAVVGRGRGPGGEMLAWGCTDEVAIEADEETDALVTMRDLDLVVDGDYSVEADIDAAAPMATMAERIETAGVAAISAAGGDGALVLDALEDALRAAGDTTAADDLAAARASAGLDAALGMRFDAEGVGPTVAVEELAALVLGRAEFIALTGALEVEDAVPTWTMNALTAHAGDPDAARLSLDLAALGVSPETEMVATWLLDEDAMQLDELRVSLPLGSVGLATLAAVAAERGADGTPGLMLPSGGCGTFQAWGAEQEVIAGACDAACLLAACKSAIEQAALSIEEALVALDAERSVVSLAGRVALYDREGDGRVDEMLGETLSGAWTPPDDREGDGVTGVLTGARMIE